MKDAQFRNVKDTALIYLFYCFIYLVLLLVLVSVGVLNTVRIGTACSCVWSGGNVNNILQV